MRPIVSSSSQCTTGPNSGSVPSPSENRTFNGRIMDRGNRLIFTQYIFIYFLFIFLGSAGRDSEVKRRGQSLHLHPGRGGRPRKGQRIAQSRETPVSYTRGGITAGSFSAFLQRFVSSIENMDVLLSHVSLIYLVYFNLESTIQSQN